MTADMLYDSLSMPNALLRRLLNGARVEANRVLLALDAWYSLQDGTLLSAE